MRVRKTVLGVLFSSLLATAAVAQDAGPDLRQPTSVRPSSYEYDNYLYSAPSKPCVSPSDVAACPGPACQSCCPTQGCESCNGCGSCSRCGCGGEGWALPQPCALSRHGVKISGWIDLGGTYNADKTVSRYNGLLAPNDRREIQLNQLYLVTERAINTEENGWDIGGRADVLYGTDYIYTQSLGWETHPDGTANWNRHLQYGVATPQLYGELGVGDLSLKLGRFYTIIGYESMMPINNFFYSHNYAVRYAEPTSHTGGLFTWKPYETLTLYAGGVNGADRTDGQHDTLAGLMGFVYTPCHKKYSLTFSIMTGGEEDGIGAVEGPRTYYSWIFNLFPEEKVNLVTQYDAGWQENFDGAGNKAKFFSLTQYGFYKINDCWKAGIRYDYFRDEDGSRLCGLRNATLEDGTVLSGGNPLTSATGIVGAAQAISVGLNWQPSKNFRLRPELRYDWFDNDDNAPFRYVFDDGRKNNQFTAAMDMLLTF